VSAYRLYVAQHNGARACQLLTEEAQQRLLQARARNGVPAASCEEMFDRPARGETRPTGRRAITVDRLEGPIAVAHEEGSAERIGLIETTNGWHINNWSFAEPTSRPSSWGRSALLLLIPWLISFMLGLRGARLRWHVGFPALSLAVGVAAAASGAYLAVFGLFVCMAYGMVCVIFSFFGHTWRTVVESVRRRARSS
jgi:hypothetical protein